MKANMRIILVISVIILLVLSLSSFSLEGVVEAEYIDDDNIEERGDPDTFEYDRDILDFNNEMIFDESLEDNVIFHDDVSEDKGYTTGVSVDSDDASEWDRRMHGAVIGDYVWDFGDIGYYRTYDFGYVSWLLSPEIDIPKDAEEVELSFDHWRSFITLGDDPVDGGNLRISNDSENFEKIYPEEGYDGEIDGHDNPMDGEEAWSNDHSWERAVFDLSAYSGESIFLEWRAGIDGQGDIDSGDGWRIDNITIIDHGPLPPTDPQPEDGATGIDRDEVELSVIVEHTKEEEIETVTFYDASDDNEIGSVSNVDHGTRTDDVNWGGLEEDETYEWYAVAEAEGGTAKSETWEFYTGKEPAEFKLTIDEYEEEVAEGEYQIVDYTVENIGEETATQDIEFAVYDAHETEGDLIFSEEEDVTLEDGETFSSEFTWGSEVLGEYSFEVSSDDDAESRDFDVIEDSIVGINVIEDPDQMSYIKGEELDLTGLEVEVDWEATGKENLKWTEDYDKLESDPADGTELTVAEHDEESITVWHIDDDAITDTTEQTLTINDYCVGVTAPEDATEQIADTYTYDFEVENTGNVDDTYELSVDEKEEWTVEIEGETTIDIDVGETETVSVEVTIPEDAGGVTNTISLTATSAENSDVSDSDSMDVTLETEHAVEVYAPEDTEVKESGEHCFYFTVENLGNVDDTYDLTIEEDEGWTVEVQDTVDVDVGESKEVTVTVEIPDNAGGVTNTVTLTSTSHENEDVSDSDSMDVTLEADYAVEVYAPEDTEVEESGEHYFDFTVENLGNVDDTYDLTIEEDEGWTVEVQDTVDVDVGESKEVTVTVEIPDNAGGETSTITLTAESTEDPDTEPAGDSDSMDVTLEAEYAVTVIAPGDETEDSPGTYTYDFDVKNTGNVDDTYDLDIEDEKEDWTVEIVEHNTIDVDVGDTETVEVEVTIPNDAEEGTNTVTLTATREDNLDISDSDTMDVNYDEDHNVEVMAPDDADVEESGEHYFDFTVENLGNVDDTYELTIEGDEGWTVEVQDTVEIDVGEYEDVTVTVDIPDDAGGVKNKITLIAASQENPEVTDSDSMDVTHEAEYAVKVTAPGDEAQDSPGTYIYKFDVENTGNVDDTYDLNVDDTEDWTLGIAGYTTIDIDVDDNKTVEVEVTIPNDAEEGTNTVKLTATSQIDEEVIASDSMDVTYDEDVSVTVIAPDDVTEQEADNYTYEFDIENTGNVDDTYDLDVEDTKEDWTVEIVGDSTIDVNVGDTEMIEVKVTIPEDAGGVTNKITLTATSHENEDVSDSDYMDVELKHDSVIDIEIETPPKKTEYIEGEKLDLTGLEVKLIWNHGEVETVSYEHDDLTNDPAHGTTLELEFDGERMTITHTPSGETAETEELVVDGDYVTEMTVVEDPKRMEYIESEELDLEGLTVELDWKVAGTEQLTWSEDNEVLETEPNDETPLTIEDNHQERIEVWHVDRKDEQVFGETEILKVYEDRVINIKIETSPDKTEYVEGEELDLSGMEIKFIWEVAEPNIVCYDHEDILNELGHGDRLNIEDEEVVVTHKPSGKTTTQNITVSERAEFDVSIDNDDKIIEGEYQIVNYTVKNIGAETATQDIEFVVYDAHDKGGDSIYSDLEEEVTLEGGQTFSSQFIWKSEEPDEYSFEVSSDDDAESRDFDVIEDSIVGINVIEDPDQMSYIKDEELDLTGVEVEVEWEVTETEILNWPEDSDVLMSEPADGMEFSVADHHEKFITIWHVNDDTVNDSTDQPLALDDDYVVDLEVVEDETIFIEVNLENEGEVKETQNVSLKVYLSEDYDGEIEAAEIVDEPVYEMRKEMILEGGDCGIKTFEWIPEQSGEYVIIVSTEGHKEDTFSLIDVDINHEDTDTDTIFSMNEMIMILVLASLLFMVVLGVTFIRKKKSSEIQVKASQDKEEKYNEKKCVYYFDLIRKGKGEECFELGIETSNDDWEVKIPKGEVTLHGDEEYSLPVKVFIPSPTKEGDKSRIVLSAVSTDNSQVSDSDYQIISYEGEEFFEEIKMEDIYVKEELEDSDEEREDAESIDEGVEEIEEKEIDEKGEEVNSQKLSKEGALEEFTRIDGIGKSKAELLYENGYHSFQDLRKATEEDLQRVKGIGPTLSQVIMKHVEK